MPISSNIPLRKATKVAGLTYILVILLGILKVNFIEPAIMSTGDADPGNSILANAMLFRIGITCEMLMYLLVVVLSLALYVILKPVHKDFALSALFLRFGESIIGTISVILSGLIPLLILDNEQVFDKAQLNALVESFLNLRIAGLNIVLLFVGSGGTIFCYLFFKSRLVPRTLAAWGIFTYVSMFMLGFINIFLPNRTVLIEIVLFSLGGLFEVIFGFWLLIKGVNIEHSKQSGQ